MIPRRRFYGRGSTDLSAEARIAIQQRRPTGVPVPATQLDLFNPTQMEPQMANAKFADILDRPADDIKPPPTLPQGPYLTILQGLPEQIESSKKKTPGLRFTHKIISPLDGVDADALAEIEGGVVGKTVRNDLWVTEDSSFMLKQFLEHCGIEFGAGKSLGAAVDETPNREVVIFIKHEASDDGERIFAKVGRTAPAEA